MHQALPCKSHHQVCCLSSLADHVAQRDQQGVPLGPGRGHRAILDAAAWCRRTVLWSGGPSARHACWVQAQRMQTQQGQALCMHAGCRRSTCRHSTGKRARGTTLTINPERTALCGQGRTALVQPVRHLILLVHDTHARNLGARPAHGQTGDPKASGVKPGTSWSFLRRLQGAGAVSARRMQAAEVVQACRKCDASRAVPCNPLHMVLGASALPAAP